MRYLYQMRIENRIMKLKRKKLKILCCSNKGCECLRAYNILANVKRSEVRSTKCLHFPKCFIVFRATCRWSERRYSYQSTEHILPHLFSINLFLSVLFLYIIFTLVQTSLQSYLLILLVEKAINTKNALHLQDTAYIKRFVQIKCALKTE